MENKREAIGKNKRGKIASLSIAGMLLLLFGFLWFSRRPEGQTVQILQDGNVLYTFSLEDAPDQVIRVEYKGGYNLIEIAGGQIRVLEADCPDQICVRMGRLHSAAPIVCLPNHLAIQYQGGEEMLDGVAN